MHIASGKYQHRENGTPNGITEIWQVSHTASNRYLLDITFQAHYTLKAQVYFDENHILEQFTYHIDENLNGSYRIQDRKLLVKRTLPMNTHLEDSLVWSENAILDLPFLSCKGHTILHLQANPNAPTFAPILHSGDRAGDLAKKSVRFIADEEISITDKIYSATHYRYRRDYWLDKNGCVLRVQDNHYEMLLVEYTT